MGDESCSSGCDEDKENDEHDVYGDIDIMNRKMRIKVKSVAIGQHLSELATEREIFVKGWVIFRLMFWQHVPGTVTPASTIQLMGGLSVPAVNVKLALSWIRLMDVAMVSKTHQSGRINSLLWTSFVSRIIIMLLTMLDLTSQLIATAYSLWPQLSAVVLFLL